MKHSEKFGEVVKALCKAKGEFGAFLKSKEVSYNNVSFKYAPFEDIVASISGELSENELIFVQSDEGKHLKSTLMHSSDQWIQNEVEIVFSQGKATDYGAALTYAKRYGLTSLLGIAAEDDDESRLEDNDAVVTDVNPNPPKNSKDPDWLGPLVKGELKKVSEGFSEQIKNASCLDDLNTTANSPEYLEFKKQAMHDYPDLLNGSKGTDGLISGLIAEVKQKRKELKQLAEFEVKE